MPTCFLDSRAVMMRSRNSRSGLTLPDAFSWEEGKEKAMDIAEMVRYISYTSYSGRRAQIVGLAIGRNENIEIQQFRKP